MLEYVMSGCSYSRISEPRIIQNPSALEGLQSVFRRLDNQNKHRYSLLFNAFTEKRYGPVFEHYKDSIFKVHSDSGGLQIVTQGKEINAEQKQKIYDLQGKHSHIAMSFDDIPVHLEDGRSGRNDTNNRAFDKDNFESYARSSAENYRDQIDYFMEHGFDSKPLMIIHGNCKDTYCKWMDIFMETLEDHHLPHVGGVSIASAAMGTGVLEDIERYFLINELQAPEEVMKNIHILGVGSIVRLIPLLMFIRNGVLADRHISYDSSTHSSGKELGFWINENGKLTKFGKERTPEFNKMFSKVCEYFGDVDEVKFHDSNLLNRTGFQKIHGEDHYNWYVQAMHLVGTSILNFTNVVNEILDNGLGACRLLDKKKRQLYSTVEQIKTADDFRSWKSGVGSYARSSRVKQKDATTSLMDFM